MALILSGTNGLSDVDGSAATPAIRGTDANTGIFFPAADTIAFAEGGVEAARFDSGGNLLVGGTTGTAGGKLTVTTANAGYVAVEPTSSVSNQIATGLRLHGNINETDRYVGIFCYNGAANNVNSMMFWTSSGGSSGERMRIDNLGNVGIGMTNPAGRLDIGGSGSTKLFVRDKSDADRGIYLDSGTSATGVALVSTNTSSRALGFATNDTERARIDSSGNLLVGTTSAITSGKQTTSFNGVSNNGLILSESANTTSATFVGFNNGSTVIGSIARVGATAAVVYNTTSDQRLKSNIEAAAPVLDKLMQVQVRQYDWTEGDLHQDYGFIAQELELVLSGVVTKGKTEEDFWQLDYSRLTPYLVKAIQEQQALIAQLQADVAALKAK